MHWWDKGHSVQLLLRSVDNRLVLVSQARRVDASYGVEVTSPLRIPVLETSRVVREGGGEGERGGDNDVINMLHVRQHIDS